MSFKGVLDLSSWAKIKWAVQADGNVDGVGRGFITPEHVLLPLAWGGLLEPC